MKILLTGGTGFIGSRLLQLSYKYLSPETEMILLTSRPVEGYRCIIHNQYTFSKEDFYDAGVTHIDTVIHLGHYVDKLVDDKVEYGSIQSITNTIHLINNLPNTPETFIYSSSCAVYGENRSDVLSETSIAMPDSIYATSKLMIEMVLKKWAEDNGVNLNILRLGHIYGPNDNRNYSIPIWLQAVFNHKPIQLYANPQMKRNCLYIDDCCKFLLKAIYVHQGNRVFNIVSNYTASMLEIAEICKKVSKNPFEISIAENYSEGELGMEIECSQDMHAFLGSEEYSLEEGLEKEFDYFKVRRNQR